MKKSTAILGVLFAAALAIFIYSCTKREVSDEKTQASNPAIVETSVSSSLISAAKQWHSSQTGTNDASLFSINNKYHYVLPPNWDDAKLQTLKNGKKLMIVSGPVTTIDSNSKYSVIRKFIFATDGNQVSNGIIVEIYGQKDYIKRHANDLLESYNDNKASDFTGKVIFYDVNYRYIVSNIVKNGKNVDASAKVSYDNGNSTNSVKTAGSKQILDVSCYDYYLVTYYTDGSSESEYLGRFCNSSSGNSDVGGGGGNNQGPTNTTPAPAPPGGMTTPGDHPLHDHPLPVVNVTQTQVGNLCTFTVMGYISTFFGTNTTVGTFLMNYCSQFNASYTDVINNGVPTSNLLTFINSKFDNNTTMGVTDAINANYPVMGTINNGTHEVFITGYNNNGTYQYYDPFYGQYYSGSTGQFANVRVITGQK